jgi:hypothetical protein
MNDLIVFSQVDEHPLAWTLKDGFRHVTGVLACQEDSYIQIDWSPTNGLIFKPVGGVGELGLIEYYQDLGATQIVVREVSRRKAVGAMMVVNNCVGHTKSALGIPSWALTPYQLYLYLRKEVRS